MNLLRNRPLSVIGAVILFAAFVFLRLPGVALFSVAIALLVPRSDVMTLDIAPTIFDLM
jgi:hypothetical protein